MSNHRKSRSQKQVMEFQSLGLDVSISQIMSLRFDLFNLYRSAHPQFKREECLAFADNHVDQIVNQILNHKTGNNHVGT